MAELNITTSNQNSDGGSISYTDAKAMINEYENTIVGAEDKNVKYFRIKAEYLRDLTASSDCEYVSFYVGINKLENNLKSVPVGHTLILVGVDENENNILVKADVASNKIYQHLRGCPPFCGKADGSIEDF